MSAPLLAFYGDDFTGSTDALECLAVVGLRAVLFVDVPNPAVLARFDGLQAVGIAGHSRALTPDEMEATMPPVLDALRRSGAPILHYKVCSTFDSAPGIGSIGRVMDIARRELGGGPIPIVVGAPAMARYSFFGTLFARHNVDGSIHRIDRHPTMSRHSTTPMGEADMRRHIAAQTTQSIALLPAPSLHASMYPEKACMAGADALLIDLADAAAEPVVGRVMQRMAGRAQPLFVVGSSGVEYALVAAWREAGLLPAMPPVMTAGPVDRIFVISGSCSPVTGGQIAAAVAAGFDDIPLDPAGMLAGTMPVEPIVSALQAGRSVVAHSSTGPDDPRTAVPASQRALAEAAAGLLRAVLDRVPLQRFVVAGGDTSTAAIRHLGIDALEMVAPLFPGAPLCRAVSPDHPLDGCEMVLKGGQMGGRDFFIQARAGRVS